MLEDYLYTLSGVFLVIGVIALPFLVIGAVTALFLTHWILGLLSLPFVLAGIITIIQRVV